MSSDDGIDAVVATARSIGRMLIDATGNGRPTRSQRIASALRFAPPLPRTVLRHPTFVSGRAGEASIVARFEDAGRTGAALPICEIGFYDASDVPLPVVARIDAEILAADEATPWPNAGRALDAIARVGRLAHHGEVTDMGRDAQGEITIVLGDSSRAHLVHALCSLALQASDVDADSVIVVAQPAPNTPVDVQVRGRLVVPDRLTRVLRALLDSRRELLRVESTSTDSMRIMRCYTSCVRGDVSPVESVAALRNLQNHFAGTGVPVEELLAARA